METQKKTYKREVAFLLLVAFFGLLIWGVLGNSQAFLAAESIKYEAFLAASGAFTLDWMKKQK